MKDTEPVIPAPAIPSSLAPGYRLDRYELLCPIADGGMASVWIARLRGKHGFEKLVAIKTILPKFAEDPRFQQMFLDEARIASRIEHANVSQILDLGEEHGILFLAMEWVDGDALSKLRQAAERRGTLVPPGIALRVLADTCGGLHAAHELRGSDGTNLGVVHRDVSPQNILVSVRGVAKLIDFGIAKARDRVADETNAGLIKGKIQYMSPEQAMGHDVDRRADVWAVGAILHHFLSGRPPYEGENQLATLHLLTGGAPPLALPAGVHPEVAAIARRALAHDPDRRFATADEMQDAIEHAMVEAKLVTTQADVAAFAQDHLADRARARKDAIEIALHAAKERARVELLLQPSRDSVTGLEAARDAGLGGMTSPARSFPVPALPAVRPSSPPSNSGIHASSSAIARDGDGSDATPGSESIDTPTPLPVVPKRGRGMLVVASLLGVALAGALALIAFLTMRAGSPTAASRTAPSSTAVAAPKPSTTATASATPTASATTTASSISAEALPTSAPPKPLLPYGAWRPNASASAAPAGPPPKKTVDDGF